MALLASPAILNTTLRWMLIQTSALSHCHLVILAGEISIIVMGKERKSKVDRSILKAFINKDLT